MNQNNDETDYPEMDYFMNEELCDVVFEVEGQRIPAPKQLLSVKSKYFRAMFSGKYKESEEEVIAIKGTTVVAFKTLMRFMICEQLVFSDDKDFEFIEEVLRLSDFYGVRRLSNKITESIIPRVNLQNLRSVTRIAFKYKLDQLMKTVNEFIKNNINDIIHKDIEELNDINDCTNDLLFDVMTSSRVRKDVRLFLIKIGPWAVYVTPEVCNKFNDDPNVGNKTIGSFRALRVLIGFFYFKRLILKDKNDFNLIREVYLMAIIYSVNEYPKILSEIRANLLKKDITFDNLKPLLGMSSYFKISDLIKNVFQFIQLNVEELVRRDVEELMSNKNSDLELIRDICSVNKTYDMISGIEERMATHLFNWITFDNMVVIHKIAADFNIEDLKTNIKTFISTNRRQLSDKDMTELREMNKAMDDTLLEVMFKY